MVISFNIFANENNECLISQLLLVEKAWIFQFSYLQSSLQLKSVLYILLSPRNNSILWHWLKQPSQQKDAVLALKKWFLFLSFYRMIVLDGNTWLLGK